MSKTQAKVSILDSLKSTKAPEDLIRSARAITEALASIDEECGLSHEALWILGNLSNEYLTRAIEMLEAQGAVK